MEECAEQLILSPCWFEGGQGFGLIFIDVAHLGDLNYFLRDIFGHDTYSGPGMI